MNMFYTYALLRCFICKPLLCQRYLDVQGRAAGHAVSRWVPTAAARVRARVNSCWFCGGQSGTDTAFILILRFPLPLLHSTNCSTIITIIYGWYNRPINGRSNSELGSTPFP
jgi:hypothetical protein